MTDCTILISNHNSYEAIQLCIESIRRYTDKPRITVFDDMSTNEMDLAYLREAFSNGWINLIEGRRQEANTDYDKTRCAHHAICWHGRSINILLGSCITRYAIILDCDVEILVEGWDEKLIAPLVTNDKALAVCDLWPIHIADRYYTVPTYKFFFGSIDMRRYWNGMSFDWVPPALDRRQEPMTTLLAGLYPPQKNFPKRTDWKNFNDSLVRGDPGSTLWLKVQYDNPKGYKVLPWPGNMAAHFHHPAHAAIDGSRYANKQATGSRFDDGQRFVKIRDRLNKLREGAA